MKRLYQLVKDDNFECCSRPGFYKKLLFSLCFFHSILLERKKFLQLGWNIVYGFNDSDFEVPSPERLPIADCRSPMTAANRLTTPSCCSMVLQVSESLLSLYLNEYEEIPWDALKYLIAGVNYGGHVTDDWDRRVLTTYINDCFCDDAVSQPLYR